MRMCVCLWCVQNACVTSACLPSGAPEDKKQLSDVTEDGLQFLNFSFNTHTYTRLTGYHNKFYVNICSTLVLIHRKLLHMLFTATAYLYMVPYALWHYVQISYMVGRPSQSKLVLQRTKHTQMHIYIAFLLAHH